MIYKYMTHKHEKTIELPYNKGNTKIRKKCSFHLHVWQTLKTLVIQRHFHTFCWKYKLVKLYGRQFNTSYKKIFLNHCYFLSYLYSTFGNISYTYIHIYKMTYIQYYSLKYLFIFENVFVIKGMVNIIMIHLYIKKYVLKS